MRTRGVGHPYTNGTADSNETWVSLEAAAGERHVLPERRARRRRAGSTPAPTVSGLLVIDENGGHMDRRQPQDIHVPLYNNGIGPGAARVVHYRVTRSGGRERARSRCRPGTHYRKFSRDYTTFSLGAAHPSLPVTTLASDTVDAAGRRPHGLSASDGSAGADARQPRPALAALERLRHRPLPPGRPARARRAAWTRVAELAPDKPDGPLNRARAEIAEGRLADAKASLAEAERRRPGWGKTAFFRATVAKDEGRLDDAERDLKAVLEKFPLDRVAWNNLGLVYWLAGRFPEAIAAYGKTLAIDPEDLNAHYNLMRVYRAMGDRKKADDPRRGLPQVQGRRDDPRGRRRLPPRATPGPTASRCRSTSTPRREPPPAAVPRLGRAIGPKGYETDCGYLTARIRPCRREPRRPLVVQPAGRTAQAPGRGPPRVAVGAVDVGLSARRIAPSDARREHSHSRASPPAACRRAEKAAAGPRPPRPTPTPAPAARLRREGGRDGDRLHARQRRAREEVDARDDGRRRRRPRLRRRREARPPLRLGRVLARRPARPRRRSPPSPSTATRATTPTASRASANVTREAGSSGSSTAWAPPSATTTTTAGTTST